MDTRSFIITDTQETNVYVAAYEKCLPRFLTIPIELLKPITFDIPWATTAALGSIPEVMKLRDEAARVPQIDVAAFDDIKDVTLALSYSHALYRASCESSDGLAALGDQAYAWREKLRVVINGLILCGLLPAGILDGYGGLKGYRNVGTDLQILTSILINSWREVGGKCPVNRRDLDAAANLAATVLTRIGIREQAPTTTAAAADIRMRAAVDFWRCWSEIRRGTTFLRWYHGDADEIAPTLFAPHKRRSSGDSQTDDPAEPSVTPSSPATPAPAPAEPANTNPGGSPFLD